VWISDAARRMKFATICSGIGAPETAWHALGWRAAFMSEIEPQARAVLAHHYPEVPLYGDFTAIDGAEHADVDVLCGGTPCQSFSVAGLRGGMADARGNLALEYLRLAGRVRPRWVVWENVPGCLSSNGGRDFGSFVRGLAELGYGWAYRVLDAQFFHLAQRRERVFVVGCLGDWRRAAAVLFEPASLRGDTAPSREAQEGVARPLASGSARGSGYRNDADTAENLIAHVPDLSLCLNAHPNRSDGESETFIAHILRADGFDASEDGTGRGTPLVVFGHQNSSSQGISASEHISPTLDKSKTPAVAYGISSDAIDRSGEGDGSAGRRAGLGITEECSPSLRARRNNSVATISAFHQNRRAEVTTNDTAGALNSGGGKPGQGYPAIQQGSAVRRLMPHECLRLQGFPDDYLDIAYKGKPLANGPRYRLIGNSMAVPVLRWIGERIERQSRSDAIAEEAA
jgi:DNA (cytosine-5)-methyltransferase 1